MRQSGQSKSHDWRHFKVSPTVIIFETLDHAAPIVRALVLTGSAVAWTLLLARLVGLRAFSKATAFDFAATIATGSLIAQAGRRATVAISSGRR